MTKNELMIVWLDSHELGERRTSKILSLFSKPEDMLVCFADKKAQIIEITNDTIYQNMYSSLNDSYINKQVKQLEKYKIVPITKTSDLYPQKLKELVGSPNVLYTRGDASLLNSDDLVSIVGTRKPTRYGRDMAKYFASELVNSGLITVSGLAYGIDAEVAKATIDCGKKTVAVLAGGLDSIYPADHTDLAEQIVNNNGLLISEYKPLHKPTNYSFPERNRIISALSNATLIIEAGEKSGSLITANFAIEQNKELFVVPCQLNSPQGIGSNRLINDIPDCFVMSPERILEFYGKKIVNKDSKEVLQLSLDEKMVFDALSQGEMNFDDLQDKLNIDTKSLNRLLTSMELSGIIKKLSGNYFSI